MRRVATLALLVLVGCSNMRNVQRTCRSNTVFLTLTFSGGAEAADSVQITLLVDQVPAAASASIKHQPSRTTGTVEVDFSSAYPAGKMLSFTVVARQGGQYLAGTSSAPVTAAPDCATVSVALDGQCGASCALIVLSPAIANTGDTVFLEGTFSSNTTVTFPGGVVQTATVLGPHRASVTVPAGVAAGGLRMTTGGSTLGSLPFRRAAFTLGLGSFARRYEQTDVGRAMPALAVARDGHASAIIGSLLYLIGGYNGTSLASVERATINADGTLSSFSLVTGLSLAIPRARHTSVMAGSSLYIIGGIAGDRTFPANVERATISGDGSLSSFTAVDGVVLTTPRSGHGSVVVGNSLYVLGGYNGAFLDTVERATIAGDGSLSPFTPVVGLHLTTARAEHTSVVVGSSLYVLGGNDGMHALATVERATIAGDGSLSPFTPVIDLKLTTPRAGHTSVAVGGSLYVLGGNDGPSSFNSVERAAINADGSLSSFAPVADLSLTSARHGHVSVLVGNSLYNIGGNFNGELASVERSSINSSGSFLPFSAVDGVSLGVARSEHISVAVGNTLYVLGGYSNAASGSLDSVEHATISPDGSLSIFIPETTLYTARHLHNTVVIGSSLYVIGGSGGGDLASVERATINPDGTLSLFTRLDGITLATARYGQSTVVIDGWLYAIGGRNDSINSYLGSVERAPIDSEGLVSTFTTVPNVVLSTPRDKHSTLVVGNSLYVIGGQGNNGDLDTVERALINPDGTLSNFAPFTGAALVTRRSGANAIVVGNVLYLVAGGNYLTSVERSTIGSDGSLSSFTRLDGLLSSGRTLHTGIGIGDSLYLIGGYNDVSRVERASLQ